MVSGSYSRRWALIGGQFPTHREVLGRHKEGEVYPPGGWLAERTACYSLAPPLHEKSQGVVAFPNRGSPRTILLNKLWVRQASDAKVY